MGTLGITVICVSGIVAVIAGVYVVKDVREKLFKTRKPPEKGDNDDGAV
ncbi:MAG: hypothetical protein VZQ61_06805 [Christensenellaceae bacterium]